MKAYKRFFALVLTLCMVLSFVPVGAFAAETDGGAATGSGQTPEGQDIFVMGSDNTQGEVKVEHATGVLSLVSDRNEEVAGLADGTYVAYDLELHKDDALYTGEATVSIPLGDLNTANGVKGFVVNAEGKLDYIDEVEIDDVLNTATFDVLLGTTVGVVPLSDEEVGATRIDLFVGDVYEETLSDVVLNGNKTDSAAVITWAGIPIMDYVLKDSGNDGRKVTLSQNEYFIDVAGTSGNNVNGTAATFNANGALRFIDPNSSGHWSDVCDLQFQFNDDGSVYIYKRSNANYLYVHRTNLTWNRTGNLNDTGAEHSKFFLYAPVADASQSSTELPGYKKITAAADLVTGMYLIAFKDSSDNLYLMNAIVEGTNAYRQMAQVQYTYNDTKVTFKGLAEGTTSVSVGNKKYYVNVTQKVVEVNLKVGESANIPDVSGKLTAGNVADPSVAAVSTTAKVVSSVPSGVKFVTPDTFKSGAQYVIVNYKSKQMVSNQTGSNTNKLAYNGLPGISATNPEYNYWTITGDAANGYTVCDQNGKWLTFGDNTSSAGTTEVKLNIYYNEQYGYWYLIDNGTYLNNRDNQPGGWTTSNQDGDNGNKHLLAQVVHTDSYTTDITFEGLTVGETSVVIGDTRYKVVVKEHSAVDVNLIVGQSKEYTDNTGYYVNSVNKADGFDRVAQLVVSGTVGTYVSGDEITTLDGLVDGTYLLVGVENGNNLTNAASDGRLQFNGNRNNIVDSAVWTITKTENAFYVQDKNNNYLTVTSEGASVGSTANEITFQRLDDHWKIVETGTNIYLNDHNSGGTVAGGWPNPNASQLSNNMALRWRIYKVDAPTETKITFTGVAEGTTFAVIGGTKYNINVTSRIDNVKKVTLYPGEVWSYIDTTGYYRNDYDYTNLDESVVKVNPLTGEMTVLSDAVTALKDGAYYILVDTGHTVPNSNTTGVAVTNVSAIKSARVDGLCLMEYAGKAIPENVWQLVKVGDKYKLKDSDGKYMNVGHETGGVDGTGDEFTITNVNGKWRIYNGEQYLQVMFGQNWLTYMCAGGWESDPTDFTLHEVDKFNGSTEVTVTAQGEGTTTFRVGTTQYEITVRQDSVDATVQPNTTKEFLIQGSAYTNADITRQPNTDIADIAVSNDYAAGNAVTSLVDGKEYLLVNNRADKTMINDDAAGIDSKAGTMLGLKLEGSKDSFTDSAVWIIEVMPQGLYRIKDLNGKYLSIKHNDADLVDEPVDLYLNYTGSAWTIAQDLTYLNDAAEAKTNAAGWEGNGASSDAGSMWSIYEVTSVTTVSITGKTGGETSATVGHMTYNIFVPSEMRDVIVSFGLPVEVTATAEQGMKLVADATATYGDVEIIGDGTTWTIRYKPTKVLTGIDVVELKDASDNVVNSFNVYPASTVYYEEYFASFGNAANKTGGWSDVEPKNKVHTHDNFGYTGYYADNSKRTEVVSKFANDTASFQFTGTGFELYGNCDPDTSNMIVLVYKVVGENKTITKAFGVLTTTKHYDPDMTGAESVVLVSENGLAYGTYYVEIRHQKLLSDEMAELKLDGFRVFNTLEETPDVYPSEEKNVQFIELRDEVVADYALTAKAYELDSEGKLGEQKELNDLEFTGNDTLNIGGVEWTVTCREQGDSMDQGYDGVVYLKSTDNKYLSVSRRTDVPMNWTFVDSIPSDDEIAKAAASFYIYAPVTEGTKSSKEVPGYVKVTDQNAIPGDNYLIVFMDVASNYYCIYKDSTNSGNNAYANMVKIVDVPGRVDSNAGETVTVPIAADNDKAANLLMNGPNNEIWLTKGTGMQFVLGTGVQYAQLGLKAPCGEVVYTITVNGTSQEITLDDAATDMFYRLSGDLSGATVTITVESGMLSVTKLKVSAGDRTENVAKLNLAPLSDAQIAAFVNSFYARNDGTDDDTTNPGEGDGTTTDPSNPDNGETTDPSDPDDGETTDPSDPSDDDLDDGETTDPSDPSDDDLDDGESTDPSDPSDADLPDNDTVTRIFGENRFETAFKVAEELKAVLNVEKFESIIVASGTNFADALSGTYLASVKNAPILLTYTEEYNQMVLDYIAENLAEDGVVYILGGNNAVPYAMDLELITQGVRYKRLGGANRFETNLLILAEAGVENQEILVCTGSNFADSLSASATGKPILLVYNESGELSMTQKLYLALLDDCNFTVIGGEKAVCVELEKAIAEYGETKRLAGSTRFETSVEIAKNYFDAPETVVLAYAADYPDALCGGVLADILNAPMVLTMDGYVDAAAEYVSEIKAEGGIVLGGPVRIADDSIVEIFALEKAEEILVK